MIPKNIDSMQRLASRYAEELGSQFRTLSLFASHAGEIGRAHEVFLRQVLTRFLPGKLRCGTGFVASSESVTRQQDIIIFDPYSLPLLLEIGDCLVVDFRAVAGTIEVKTTLDKRADFSAEVEKILAPLKDARGRWFRGLYMWDGLSLEAALECLWDLFRSAARVDMVSLPDIVYARGRYLIVPNYDGRLDTAPLRVLRLGEGHHDEGVGLLTLVERMWMSGIQDHATWPWWADAWHTIINEKYEYLPWPEDLRTRVHEQLQTGPKSGLTWNMERRRY